MGIEKLISLAVILAVSAASSGRLPRIIYAVRVAELHLPKESQASNWGQAMLLPTASKNQKTKVTRQPTLISWW